MIENVALGAGGQKYLGSESARDKTYHVMLTVKKTEPAANGKR